MEGPHLSASERERYSRHLLIPGIGESGQLRLKAASVLCVGTGGLGCPAALYLAAAGVGRIGLIDPDVVDRSNLQRQILHGESFVGRSKLESAAARLRDLNPDVQLDLHPVRFTPENAAELVADYDIVLDGSDNFPTRYLTNDVCFVQKKPNIYGAIFRFDGQVSVFAPHRGGPCYRCMVPTLPAAGSVPSCNEAGVLGVLPGVVGSLMAMEAIKWILDLGEPPLGKLLCYDALSSRIRPIQLRCDPECKLCGEHPSLTSLDNPETRANLLCTMTDVPSIDVATLATYLNSGRDGLLIDVREPSEYEAGAIQGSQLIPLGTLPDELDGLPKDRDLWIHCQGGMRSARATQLLLDRGFERVWNVSGGYRAWVENQ